MTRLAVALLVLAFLAAPLVAEAQQVIAVPRIGLLDSASFGVRAPLWEAFRQGMRALGYIEGRNVIYEARSAEGKLELLPAAAADLVRLKVDTIVTVGGTAGQAALKATATIPIVMTGGDPIGTGRAASLARPGGNVTGFSTLSVHLSAKRFELARELVPAASRLAILWYAGGAGAPIVRETEEAARAQSVRLDIVGVRSVAELDSAFSTIAQGGPVVLLIVPSPIFFEERRRLADLARKHRLPIVSGQREYAEAGALVAYGAPLAELFRRAAVYVDKILKGAKPADLPIEQPTKFELVINDKTAKALGLTIPQSVLLRADEVIQ